MGLLTDVETFIIFCKYDEVMTRSITENAARDHEHVTVWKVLVNDNNLNGASILKELRRLRRGSVSSTYGQNPDNWNTPPVLKDYYNPAFGGGDSTAFCYDIHCEIIEVTDPTLWRITAKYGPPQDSGASLIYNTYLPTDPFQWFWKADPDQPNVPGTSLGGFVTNAWIEFVEDQKVIETATCVTNLEAIERGPSFDNEPGPIVNAAGQQTIDPIVEPVHRVIFNVVVNYPDFRYAMGLNDQFGRSVHAPTIMYVDDVANPVVSHQYDETDQKLFMGYPHGTWKFLIAEPGKQQYRYVETTNDGDDGPTLETSESRAIIEYCPTTIKLELNLGDIIESYEELDYWTGWMKAVLNNGQSSFRKWNDKYNNDPPNVKGTYIKTPEDSTVYQLFPVEIKQLNADAVDQDNHAWDSNDTRTSPSGFRSMGAGQFSPNEPSEPLNLKFDGTPIEKSTDPAEHILYNQLKPRDYYDITDYYGRRIFPYDLFPTLPGFPLPNTVSSKPSEPSPLGGGGS